jgi:hypothetical protein
MTTKIGIFWFYKEKVIGHASPVSAGEESFPGMIDSPKNHADVWDECRTLLKDFPELRGQEYYCIPRGRVLWNKNDQHAIVYMDSTLFNALCKELITAFFNLEGCEVKWKTDSHYTTKSEGLTALFDEEY